MIREKENRLGLLVAWKYSNTKNKCRLNWEMNKKKETTITYFPSYFSFGVKPA